MTNEQTQGTISGEAIQAFADKLETWAQGLDPKEQALLESIPVDAAHTDTDGYIERALIERRAVRLSLADLVLVRIPSKLPPAATPEITRPGQIKRLVPGGTR